MQFCFIKGSVSLVMPVTPGNYSWTVGKKLETVNISALGDVYRPGGRARFSGGFEFLLPAQAYPWLEPGAFAEPQYYLDHLDAWAKSDEPVRFVITETEVNALVYIEEVESAERDGTGDRYVTVRLREYVDLLAEETVDPNGADTGNYARSASGSGPDTTQSYTVVRGDTLSAICRRFYGKSTAKYYNALAAFNGVKNPHLIYPGSTLRIPPESTLLGGAA